MTRRPAVVAGLLAVVAFAGPLGVSGAGGATATAASPTPSSGAFLPVDEGAALPHRNAEAYSLNWSGYTVVPRKPVTGVRTTFRVPKAGLVPPGFASTWAGIGGYTGSDLIQAGAAEQSSGLGGPRYYAWVETLPDPAQPIAGCTGDKACTVRPGDVMTVDIHQLRRDVWVVTVANKAKWTWQRTIPYRSSRSSAEWILEAPSVGGIQTTIAPVGTAYFGRTNTYTAGGVRRTIAAGKPVRISLSPGLITLATPSRLAPNGQSFNACAYRSECPTPAR